ncbi:hypothetical protein RB614_35270 [Phytohabitans sp. ZYX-F-186]|uniref:Uncharacterized protein n=1 Tax=Phytohabitans maris TaxID=3071409 RepID=A0ABU0ZS35_9ACTN|nr:hypothetical protein [Phytohabitans sp. ZYX-F-186]MDQ7909773.1 hypothetical protein [Phytohabitans sp. ZYX-F-186]
MTGLAAASLALSIAVAGTGVPAQAAETKRATETASPQLFAFDWVSLTVAVAGYLLSGSGGGGNLEAAINEIKLAIEQSKTEIIAQIDAIAAAEVEACLEAHTIEFLNIDFMDEFTLRAWAQNATNCATQASAFAGAVQSPQAVDKIGFVIGPIFAIVLAARAQAGFVNGTDLVLQSQIRAYEAVVTKLTPTNCQLIVTSEGSAFYEKWWTCWAYNGDVGRSSPCFGRNCMPNRTTAENQATLNTSRPVAVVALPRLRAALP